MTAVADELYPTLTVLRYELEPLATETRRNVNRQASVQGLRVRACVCDPGGRWGGEGV